MQSYQDVSRKLENTDKRKRGNHSTVYDDRLSNFEKRLYDELGLGYLIPPVKKWWPPAPWMIKHSKVSDEHKAALKRRNKNKGSR